MVERAGVVGVDRRGAVVVGGGRGQREDEEEKNILLSEEEAARVTDSDESGMGGLWFLMGNSSPVS